ncbi:MAG: hypothetical protein NTW59_04840, partial [Candidatus Diapherotrites archaeon]|nr:hypothetical protein [Candidatus Diapherotrites archaeon]
GFLFFVKKEKVWSVESKPPFVTPLLSKRAVGIRLSRLKALHPRLSEEATVPPPFHPLRVSFLFRGTILSDVTFVGPAKLAFVGKPCGFPTRRKAVAFQRREPGWADFPHFKTLAGEALASLPLPKIIMHRGGFKGLGF